MTLQEQLTNDLKSAMKNTDKFALGVYRLLKSAIQMEQINKKRELEDDEIIAVIKKQVKMRHDSMEEYQKCNRDDLVKTLEDEISILNKYLPKELSTEKIEEEIDNAFKEINPQSMKDMGSVMKLLTERIATQADMSEVSKKVKERLMK